MDVVDFSPDLNEWEAVGDEVLAESIDEDFDYVIWRDSATLANSENRFARVRVERIE